MFWPLASAKRFGGARHTKTEVYPPRRVNPPMAGQNVEFRMKNVEYLLPKAQGHKLRNLFSFILNSEFFLTLPPFSLESLKSQYFRVVNPSGTN